MAKPLRAIDTVEVKAPAVRPRLTLQLRLLLLVLASVLPLLGFSLWHQYQQYRTDVAHTGQQTLDLARGLSAGIERELKRRVSELRVLAYSRALQAGDIDAFRTQAEIVVAEHFPGSNIVLLKEDGQQVMNTALPLGAPLPVRQDLETQREVFATGLPAVSDLYNSIALKRPVISIEVPVRANGRVIYTLANQPPLDAFATVIANQRASENGIIAVFDRKGVNVARTRSPERFVGQKAGPELLARMLADPEGITEARSREGIPVVAAFSRGDTFGWTVAIGVSAAELTGPAFASAMRILAAGGILLVLSLLMALLVARRIAVPIGVLGRLARSTDSGEVLNPPPTGLGETDEVAEALRAAEMRRKQGESIILERTADLEAANRHLQNEMVERQRAEQQTRSKLAHLDLLRQITQAMGERQDLQSIFQVVTQRLEDELPTDYACFCLYDPPGKAVTVASIGIKGLARAPSFAMAEHVRIAVEEGSSLARCLGGELVYAADLDLADFAFPRRPAQGGLRSAVAAPLQVESQVLGILLVARAQPAAFSSAECEFILQLSQNVALAAKQIEVYRELQHAYDELRRTQQAMLQQERLRALGQMASGIAHDVNNALSPVALYIESLLETEPDLSDRARQYLEIIQRAVDDVAQTVTRMRDFSRERAPHLQLLPVQLNDLVPQVIDLTRARWSDIPQQAGTAIDVRKELAIDLPVIAGVESEIREALTNLVLNAVDALPEGGVVTVRTSTSIDSTTLDTSGAENRAAVVEVADTGIGMDEEACRRCLEPFFTTKGERGTGLGLAMVYGAAQRHGAKVEIDSAVGLGTVVRLVFPVSRTPIAEASRTVPAVAPPAKQMKLLLIDDDALVLRSLREILAADGHLVLTAGSGPEGIVVFTAALERGEPFAAVFTDLGMPHMDGHQVAAAIKKASATTPVVLLTGWGQQMSDEGNIPANVDQVLGKPPRLRNLRDALVAVGKAQT